MRKFWIFLFTFFSFYFTLAQTPSNSGSAVLIKAAKIFDGENILENIWGLVKGNVIAEVGAPQSFSGQSD